MFRKRNDGKTTQKGLYVLLYKLDSYQIILYVVFFMNYSGLLWVVYVP